MRISARLDTKTTMDLSFTDMRQGRNDLVPRFPLEIEADGTLLQLTDWQFRRLREFFRLVEARLENYE